jgi:hypothetical protein
MFLSLTLTIPPNRRPSEPTYRSISSGVAISDINVQEYSSSQHQAIMSAVMDTDSLMWQQNVSHCDMHPRNIIVVAAKEGERADIRMIDSDFSRCSIRALQGQVPSTQLEPRSAAVGRWLDKDILNSMYHFDWLVDWPWDQGLKDEYAKDKKGETP